MIIDILDALFAGIVVCTAAIFFIIGRAWEYASPTVKRKDRAQHEESKATYTN